MTRNCLNLCVTFACMMNVGFSQEVTHTDVFFTYGATQIEIAEQSDGLVIPQIMPTSGFFAQANANPGFFSETDLGGGTGANDILAFNVLDNLLFWSEGDFAEQKPSTRIRVINNPSFVDDTLIGRETGEQPATFSPLTNSIGQSNDGGDFHAHVDFHLEPDSEDPEEKPLFGAYGLKLSLASDNAAVEDSDPFFVVFQFGIEEDQFAEALEDFHELLLETNVRGDFDGDGSLSASDIDLLSNEVIAGTNDASFDLTSDEKVDEFDRTEWVELAGSLFGDANLDGTVQFPDFVALSTAYGMPGGWADGDFDGNGVVQFADFVRLSSNFGQGEPNIATVPEPSGVISILFAVLTSSCLLRRSRVESISSR